MIVHQALHGYSDGHRLISSSLPLSSAAARAMLVMSDLSGPGVKPGPSGYLTGYPLDDLGKYVLARTWAAPEMPRPGCVWTHSLVIDKADLAALSTAQGLLTVFRRPAGPSPRSEYDSPLLTEELHPTRLRSPRDRFSGIVNALYAEPDRSVIVEADDAEADERLLTAIWMQQWPRLRRSFGFCTLSGMDRSSKGVFLDLQLVRSGDRQLRSQFPNAVTPNDVLPEPALEPLLADLEGTSGSRVREFLRRAGGDVAGGRKAMIPLCRLYSSIFVSSPPDLKGAVAALGSLDALGPSQARSVRTLVVRTAIEAVEQVDDAVFDFLVDALEQSGGAEGQPVPDPRFGAALWRRSPVRFVEAINDGGVLGEASTSALSDMDAAELVAGLKKNASLAPHIVDARPDLLERVDFWRIPRVDEDLAQRAADRAAGRVAGALLSAERIGPAPSIVGRADPGALAVALDTAKPDATALPAWLHALALNPNKAAAVLASARVRRLSTVVGLARASGPDDVPNDFGEDPWLIAVRSASGPVRQADEDYLAAFLMSRALGSRSRSQAELIRVAYTRVYEALQRSRLSPEAHRFLSWRLDWGSWFEWDSCSRLRETVTRRFVDGDLDAETFGRLTDNGPLAKSLFDEAAKTARGRRYLGRVCKRLKSANEKGMRARADYIAEKAK